MTYIRSSQPSHTAGRAALLIAGLITLTACATTSSPATALGQDKATLATCDSQHAPASWVAIDGTGSSAADSIYKERLAAIESITRTTAICSGYLRVIVFSASSVATTVLYDGSLAQPGATENARLLRVPGAVASVMNQVKKGYGPAVAGLDPRDSDILGQYANAAQWTEQLGGSYRLHLYLLTDGFETAHFNFYAQPPTPGDAAGLAQQVSLPSLPGAIVVAAGLGREVGPSAPSTVVDGLVAFYNAVCHRTGAAKCVSVSDYQAAGK
ncbi:MAG TPA: hypothetical protein VHX38_41240 [Pseudonocardiaceae bacterium]|jgi:hypothetical protein|nr:hypothetical protein [Pseudonocardiaceae bacterium]